jgi:hypothetical protein
MDFQSIYRFKQTITKSIAYVRIAMAFPTREIDKKQYCQKQLKKKPTVYLTYLFNFF